MYSLIDRMFIQGLKALLKAKVKRELLRRLDSNIFARAIFDIYNLTPENDRDLRDLVVRVTIDYLTELRTREELT